jgi:archaellum component FlaC
MKFTYSKLLLENKTYILENVKQAKVYVDQGKLSKEELEQLIQIDPTPTRKFVGWMAKQWINKTVTDIDDLRNIIEEYNTFLEKGKVKTKDINQFKSFSDLYNEVNQLNQSGEGISVKDLESDYDVVIDNSDLLIMSPHTHEASRKLGLSYFAFRDCKDGGKDSAWCTTYKAPNHFNDYYYKNNVTFYYIKVKSQQMIEQLKEAFPKRWKSMVVVALAVLDNGKIDGYDGLDKQIKEKDIETYTSIIGIS